MEGFKKATLWLSIVSFVLLVFSTIMVIREIRLHTTVKKSYLNYGFNSSWKLFQLVYAPYYNNIPNRVTSENYWKARKWFDEETVSLYKIHTLESWEIDMDRVSSNSNLSYNQLRNKFDELNPVWPMDVYTIASSYGFRFDPFGEKKNTGPIDETFHEGVDIAAERGSDVRAFLDGVVTRSMKHPGYGNVIEIDHGNGFKTRYAHLKKILVKKGESVVRGRVIALSGNTGKSTGPHLHYVVWYNGVPIDPYLLYPEKFRNF